MKAFGIRTVWPLASFYCLPLPTTQGRMGNFFLCEITFLRSLMNCGWRATLPWLFAGIEILTWTISESWFKALPSSLVGGKFSLCAHLVWGQKSDSSVKGVNILLASNQLWQVGPHHPLQPWVRVRPVVRMEMRQNWRRSFLAGREFGHSHSTYVSTHTKSFWGCVSFRNLDLESFRVDLSKKFQCQMLFQHNLIDALNFTWNQ